MTVQVGVTGSRSGATPAQYDAVREILRKERKLGSTLHHGCATGVDLDVHVAAWVSGWHVVGHPPLNPKARAWVEKSDFWDQDTDVLLPEKPYLDRNLDIVKAVDLLIVVPDGPYRIRSGTWSTFSAALREGVPTVVIKPDGTIG